jgi:outer membrane murein-binding lipoprotein Lpp
LQRRKTRTRRLELGAALAAALCLAGCGGGSEPRAAAPQPKLPSLVATALASRSDEVARALTAGDSCRALGLAQQLQRDTIASINAGRVPGAFQEQLASTVGDLVSRIQCVPAEEKHDRGKHKGKHSKDGKDD